MSKPFVSVLMASYSILTEVGDKKHCYDFSNHLILEFLAGGEVYVWDLKAQDCLQKCVDDGCIRGTSLAVSRNNRYLACGSDSGIVNIYRRKDVMDKQLPMPEKIVTNLTTTVTSLKFNPSSEILAMASESKEGAIKLLHTPSMTVFKNFPPVKFNLKRPNCMDFSLNGGYFSVGNNAGAANLFR